MNSELIMSSISESSFQEFGQPIAVGLVSTEGEKLLKALRKIQFKLKDNNQKHEKSGQKLDTSALDYKTLLEEQLQSSYSLRGSGDHRLRAKDNNPHKCPEPVICSHNKSEDISNQLIETRLKLIETQLQNISMQLMANNCVKHEINANKQIENNLKTSLPKSSLKTSPSKTKTRISTIEDEIQCDDKYEASIDAIKQMIRSNDNQKMSKSVSLDAINNRYNPSKHFHLQYRDIPFILGTNSSKSYSVIANRQIEISKLKQHNDLCRDRMPSRKIFSQTLKTKVLDNEIKDLLYDLQEEHNYICEEIHYLSKQLETITDPKRRIDFNRELYFLSRRILAKKRQINELQELHAIVRKNGIKDDEQRVDTKPDSRAKREIKSNVGNKCVNNESIPKWF